MRPFLMILFSSSVLVVSTFGLAFFAQIVPNEIQQPGTQDDDGISLLSPDKCDQCHGDYDEAVEPGFTWRGSMMANATRDPIFWATVAIAEQDFDGSGDLCIRCHTTKGWLAERSTPTDGSSLTADDTDGVDCAFCHRLCNTDDSEYIGVMIPPFEANDEGNPPVGYYGSGMSSIWHSNARHGPYADVNSNHGSFQSKFQRDVNYCGTCHDVSNPAVGDLAHNNGTLDSADPVTASGVPGAPVDDKAAFNNFPFMYGIVERTFSEYMSGLLSQTLVSDYTALPAELKAGALKVAYEAALTAGTGGNYEDGTARYFSCQTCHVPPVTGKGSNKTSTPVRKDLPMHDLTGGNYWMPEAMKYLDGQGKLLLGGGLTSVQKNAMDAGAARAKENLGNAIALSLNGETLKVVNLTGHKVISGYPEGRRMWLNVKWYAAGGALLREDGAYGTMNVILDGNPLQVDTILDLDDTRIYEAQPGMTKEWADQLISLGYSPSMVLSFDRITGAVDYTLGDLAAEPAGAAHKSFHFVLNNTMVNDNRIPPYGMDHETARKRNALPVPETQYGGPGGAYRHWDEIALDPPAGADRAEIRMLYQPTSWEYIQFLYLANDGSVVFLAKQGEYMLEAWLNTGMAGPEVMAEIKWSAGGLVPKPMDPTSRKPLKGMGGMAEKKL